MKRISLLLLLSAALFAANVRVNINLGFGHPIQRPRTVIVHREPLIVERTVVYAAPVVWAPAIVVVPPRPRIVWEDSETILRREDWVDTNLAVHNTGEALLLRLEGRARVDFAEVHFRNGQARVVDFHESVLNPGVYRLLDFEPGREVASVRLVAKAETPRATLGVLLRK